jgi:hypothetical protein
MGIQGTASTIKLFLAAADIVLAIAFSIRGAISANAAPVGDGKAMPSRVRPLQIGKVCAALTDNATAAATKPEAKSLFIRFS